MTASVSRDWTPMSAAVFRTLKLFEEPHMGMTSLTPEEHLDLNHSPFAQRISTHRRRTLAESSLRFLQYYKAHDIDVSAKLANHNLETLSSTLSAEQREAMGTKRCDGSEMNKIHWQEKQRRRLRWKSVRQKTTL